MPDDRTMTFQIAGSIGVLAVLTAIAIYGWGWGGLNGSTPYLLGVVCVGLAAAWAAYERI